MNTNDTIKRIRELTDVAQSEWDGTPRNGGVFVDKDKLNAAFLEIAKLAIGCIQTGPVY